MKDRFLSEIADAGRLDQPLGDRRDGDARHVHGSAGHFHRQRGAAAHFRKFVGGCGRIDLGADVVSGFERDRSAAFRMAFGIDWTQTVLHVVRGAVYGEFVFVRTGAEPGRAGAVPHSAGCRRRRSAAQRTGNFERHVQHREARHGVCGVRHRRRRRADDRAVAGRLDHRQLFVALDFLYQRAGREFCPWC